jgi:hypothetical protein
MTSEPSAAPAEAGQVVSLRRRRRRTLDRRLLVIVLPAAAAGYTLYYGNLHSHTSYSDGASVPRHAFAYARDTADIDFLAVTDHGELLSVDEWNDVKAQADSATVPNVFVGLAGFEWTNPVFGHANALNTTDRTNVLMHPTPESFYDWLTGEPGALAQFDHPGAGDFRAFAHSPAGDRAFGLYEMQSTNHAATYHVPLDSGWHVGLSANQDNHGADWGAGQRLTGIWAGALDRDSILSALAQMRVFGTLDRNAWLRFSVGDSWMGSTVPNGRLTFDIVVGGPDPADTILRIDLVTNQGVVVDSQVVGDTNHVEWQPVVTTDSDAHRYFFVRATLRDTALVVSSPIWTEPATALLERAAPLRPECGLRAWPNPFVSAVSLRPDVPGTGTLAIYDAAGSRIHRSPAVAAANWDGRDDRGRAVPAGVYVARWTADRRSSTVRLLRLVPR